MFSKQFISSSKLLSSVTDKSTVLLLKFICIKGIGEFNTPFPEEKGKHLSSVLVFSTIFAFFL